MRLQIESPHLIPGKKIIELVRKQFEPLEKRYDRIHHCTVILQKGKDDAQKSFYVEARMEVPGKMLFAGENAETFDGTELLSAAEELAGEGNSPTREILFQ